MTSDPKKNIKRKVCVHLKCKTYLEGFIYVTGDLRFSNAVLKKLNEHKQFPMTEVIIDHEIRVSWLVVTSDYVAFVYPCENIQYNK
jgi:hypothetical protein